MDKNDNMHESILMDDTHKFLPNGNEQNVESSEKKIQIQFNGLSKEEVMRTANDPAWVRLRWALLILFWVVWFGMLIAAGVIVYVTPKCPFIPKQVRNLFKLILFVHFFYIFGVVASKRTDLNVEGGGILPLLLLRSNLSSE